MNIRKFYLLILLTLAYSLTIFSQAPEGINYQAVARDVGGQVLHNQVLSVRFTIHKNSPVDTIVYQESHSATTNEFGLFTLVIGEGSKKVGTLDEINWGGRSFFLQVEIDDGSGFVSLGSTQLLSVPYALYAKEAGNGGEGGDDWGTQAVQTETTLKGDGTSGNELGLASQGASSGEVLMWDGSHWAPSTVSGGGSLWTQVGSDIYYSNGNVGIGTSTPLTGLHVGNSTNVLFGKAMTGGPDNRFMWISNKAAFRAGRVVSINWDPDSIGQYSVAMGDNTKATGQYTTAFGRSTIASGQNATAFGSFSTASDDNATAIGYQTTASNIYTTAFGRNTSASGPHATAMGRNSEASGNYSTAFGYGTEASGDNTLATGYNTTASGPSSMAMGYNTTANDLYSTAMGRNSLASGKTSFALGDDPIASGDYSLATGNDTWAAGKSSTAMGDNTYASGNFSTALGESTTAPSGYETVLGRYNTSYSPTSTTGWNVDDRLFVIGNGNSPSSKSDAMVVLKNGKIGIGTSTPQCDLEIIDIDDQTFEDGALRVEYKGTEYFGTAIYGKADTSAWQGYGGFFEGTNALEGNGITRPNGSSGAKGVIGEATEINPFFNVGVQGRAGESQRNYGFTAYAYTYDANNYAYAFYGSVSDSLGSEYAGYFDGDVHVIGTLTNPSDRKFKQEIEPFMSALNKVKQLGTYNYRYRKVEGMKFCRGKQIGFIAQDMEEVFPELVKDEVNAVPPKEGSQEEPLVINYKGINYIGMIPVLTRAIQEQQDIIEDQQKQLDHQAGLIHSLQDQLDQIQKQLENDQER